MTNSDNTYGTYNKLTNILSQIDDGSTALTTFADVATAKAHFFTDSALTVMDECCTELQWELIGNTGLKMTFAFGTKGTTGIAAADDWAGQYNSRKTALIDANNWMKSQYTGQNKDGDDMVLPVTPGFTLTSTDNHLF